MARILRRRRSGPTPETRKHELCLWSLVDGARHDACAATAYLYLLIWIETGKRASLGAHHGEELPFLDDLHKRSAEDWSASCRAPEAESLRRIGFLASA